MLELINISKHYPVGDHKKTVLDNISFHFKRGENVGIIGLNGAGKSTLLRIISGSEMPDSGQVKRNMLLSWPLGFAGGFNGSLSGAENCRFICRVYGKNIAKITAFTEDFAELGEYFHQPINTYSSGMRSRLSFALSMAIEFDCYLIDEILSTGDQPFQKKCQKELELRKKTSSLILVSHSPQKIKTHCDSILVLDQGKLRYYSDMNEGIDAYTNLGQRNKATPNIASTPQNNSLSEAS